MSITFPSSPTAGQSVTQNGRNYVWSGSAWELYGNVAAHAATHGVGGSDPITPAAINAVAKYGDAIIDGNVRVGQTSLDNGVRYLDAGNVGAGENSGAVLRLITLAAANPNITTAAVLAKYRHGGFGIINNEPSASAYMNFLLGEIEVMRLASSGSLGLGASVPAISSGSGIHCAGSTFRLATSRTPASPTATGNTGEICWDANYLYVCVATNTWRQIPIYRQGALEGSFNQTPATIDVFPRGEAAITTVGNTSGTVRMTFFTPLVTTTVTQITAVSGNTASSGLTLARFGLYTFDETTATLVARTASDTSIFAAINTAYTRSLDSTGGYPSSYTLTAGVRYGVALILVGTTMGTLTGRQVGTGVESLPPRMTGQSTGRTDLPATTTVVTALGQMFARLT